MSQISKLVKARGNRLEGVLSHVEVQEMIEMEDGVKMARKHSITEVKADDMTGSVTGNSIPGTTICLQIPKLNFRRSPSIKKVLLQLHQGRSLVVKAMLNGLRLHC